MTEMTAINYLHHTAHTPYTWYVVQVRLYQMGSRRNFRSFSSYWLISFLTYIHHSCDFKTNLTIWRETEKISTPNMKKRLPIKISVGPPAVLQADLWYLPPLPFIPIFFLMSQCHSVSAYVTLSWIGIGQLLSILELWLVCFWIFEL